MARAKSDGNGGFDINVQKKELGKYGAIGAIVILAFSGAGTALGSQVWDMIANDKAQTQKIEYNEARIERNKARIEKHEDEQDKLVAEFIQSLSAIREELVAVRVTLEKLD